MAKLNYTEQEHHLIRAFVLLRSMIDACETDVLYDDSLRKIVGKPIPVGTIKMVSKDAHNALVGKMTFNQYFKRTSQSKRKESK